MARDWVKLHDGATISYRVPVEYASPHCAVSCKTKYHHKLLISRVAPCLRALYLRRMLCRTKCFFFSYSDCRLWARIHIRSLLLKLKVFGLKSTSMNQRSFQLSRRKFSLNWLIVWHVTLYVLLTCIFSTPPLVPWPSSLTVLWPQWFPAQHPCLKCKDYST